MDMYEIMKFATTVILGLLVISGAFCLSRYLFDVIIEIRYEQKHNILNGENERMRKRIVEQEKQIENIIRLRKEL